MNIKGAELWKSIAIIIIIIIIIHFICNALYIYQKISKCYNSNQQKEKKK